MFAAALFKFLKRHYYSHGKAFTMNFIGYAPSARIYTVADKDEAWLVQVVHGRNYVAVRCPDDQITIMPNLYTVYELDAFPAEDVIASPDLVENAKRKGFWDGSGKVAV